MRHERLLGCVVIALCFTAGGFPAVTTPAAPSHTAVTRESAVPAISKAAFAAHCDALPQAETVHRGEDAVGIVLYEPSGPTPVTVTSEGYVHNGEGEGFYTYNPSTGEPRRGVLFAYSDSIRCTKALSPFSYEWTYRGYGFSTAVTYDASFADFHGKARTAYCHTWKSTSVRSLRFTADTDSFAIQAQFTGGDHVVAYSDAYTIF